MLGVVLLFAAFAIFSFFLIKGRTVCVLEAGDRSVVVRYRAAYCPQVLVEELSDVVRSAPNARGRVTVRLSSGRLSLSLSGTWAQGTAQRLRNVSGQFLWEPRSGRVRRRGGASGL